MTQAPTQPALLDRIDAMVEFAVSHLTETQDAHRTVTRALVQQWPHAEGLQFVFVLVSAAHALEATFAKDAYAADNTIDQVFRLAALLATDLFALRLKGTPLPLGTDLITHWQQSDPYFLEL